MGGWQRKENFQVFLLKSFSVSVIFKMFENFSLDMDCFISKQYFINLFKMGRNLYRFC